MSLTKQYGEEEIDIGEPGWISQSIEQEFISYTTAPLSGKSVDILKFWEVGYGIKVTSDTDGGIQL